jgi:hypothetical protein
MARLSKEKIEQNMLHFDDHDIDDEFMGIAVWLNESGSPKHSGIVLCYDGEKLFFHFTSQEVLLDDVTGDAKDIYYKKLELFPDIYLPYIRAHFDLLLETVNPKYGFIFTNSFYNDFGTYISDIDDLPDFCTCAGFCINVIRSLLLKNPKYIEIDDWKNESLEKVNESFINYVDNYLKLVSNFKPEKLEEVKAATYKRITPLELLISGFFAKPNKIPVRKSDIDPKISDTRRILREKWIAIDEF